MSETGTNPNVIHVQFNDDKTTMRKWASEPFIESVSYINANNVAWYEHQLERARAIISRQMLGMKAWAADEDGIHDAAMDPFWEGARFLGVDFELKVDREDLEALSNRVPAKDGQEGGIK